MNPLPHRGKLLAVTLALACGSLAASAVAQVAQVAAYPAAAIAAHTQAGSQYQPPDPC